MSTAQAVAGQLGQPSPRRWPMCGVLLGGILITGPFWGLLGTVIGMARSFAVIETLKAPSPDDLNAGVEFSLNATILGFGASVLGAVILGLSVLALMRHQLRVVES